MDKLSVTGETILDFCAGYGGRLLAALSLQRAYVGIDPAQDQCTGLKRMDAFFGGNASIVQGCAEDVMPELPSNSFDLVLSSPPYFRLERYSNEPSQSYRKYSDYQSWLSGFLERVLEQSHRTLRRGGHLALNVSNTQQHRIAADADSIARSVFRCRARVYFMSMSTNPADKARNGKFLRTEPILVYEK